MTEETLKTFWSTWAPQFWDLPKPPMDDQLTHIFMVCSVEEDNEQFPPKEVELGFSYRLFVARARAIGLNTTNAVNTLIASYCDRPGALVMFAYALRYLQQREKVERVSMDTLAFAFPTGFPTMEGMGGLWEQQKGINHGMECDNILDQIMFDPTL